jgi:hypothetical protein
LLDNTFKLVLQSLNNSTAEILFSSFQSILYSIHLFVGGCSEQKQCYLVSTALQTIAGRHLGQQMLNVEIICERRLDEGVHAGGVAGQTLLLNRKLFVSADWTKVSMLVGWQGRLFF